MKFKSLSISVLALSLLVVSCGAGDNKDKNKPQKGAESTAQTVTPAVDDATPGEEEQAQPKEFELGNKDLVMPLHVKVGTTTHYLTDYYPQWSGADKVTTDDERLSLVPLKDDWSEFSVTTRAKNFVSTIDVWHGESKLSIVVLGGERNKDNFMSAFNTDKVCANKSVGEAVVMWQNQRVESVEVDDDRIYYTLPEAAKDYKRSYVRIFAAKEDGRFNDVLIPLDKGFKVSYANELMRQDKHSQVLYSLMIDRFNNGNKSNDWKLNSPEVLDKVDYQGGDIAGITEKINDGFFTRLGISTIWISPITQNPYDAWGQNVNPDTKFSGYHGYWPIYSTVVDKRFGSDEELRQMLATAHDNNHNVILDYVANHLHINSPVLQEHPDWTTPLIPLKARDRVTSSVYSRSAPTGMPWAMRVTRMPMGLISRAM